MSLRVSSIWATGSRRCENSPSQRLMSRHWPTAAKACTIQSLNGGFEFFINFHTCMRGIFFGLSSTSILRNPTPTAPEETRTTLWPSRWSLAAVSTMSVRIERIGSWVCSSTIELVPVWKQVVRISVTLPGYWIPAPNLMTTVRRSVAIVATKLNVSRRYPSAAHHTIWQNRNLFCLTPSLY